MLSKQARDKVVRVYIKQMLGMVGGGFLRLNFNLVSVKFDAWLGAKQTS